MSGLPRLIFAVLLLVILTGPVLSGNDWTGKTVFLKGDKTVRIHQTDSNGKQVYVGELKDIDFLVIKEHAGLLKVRQGKVEGWFDKADAVVLEEAVGYFTGRIKANEQDADAYGRRAVAWHRQGELDNAIKDFNEALKLKPGEESFWNNRGLAWNDKREYEKAIQDFNEVVRLNPKNGAAYYNRGNSWFAKQDFDKAIQDYTEAIRLNPNLGVAYMNRGNVWGARKDYHKAIQDHTEAIRLDPENMLAYYNRAVTWHRKQDYDKAIQDYGEVIRLNPKFAVAFLDRGDGWLAKKDYPKAAQDYNDAIRLDPMSLDGHESLAWLLATCPDAKVRDGKRAVVLETVSQRVLARFQLGSIWHDSSWCDWCERSQSCHDKPNAC